MAYHSSATNNSEARATSYIIFHWLSVDLAQIIALVRLCHVENGQVIHAFFMQNDVALRLREFLRLPADQQWRTIWTFLHPRRL